MKVKLDENIPVRLVGVLATLRHDVDTVASEGLKGKPDGDVWSVSRRDARFLITQDLDFSDMRQFRPGTHAGLLLVRLREPGANARGLGRARRELPRRDAPLLCREYLAQNRAAHAPLFRFEENTTKTSLTRRPLARSG